MPTLGERSWHCAQGGHPGAACGRARGHKKGRPKGRLGGTGPGGGEAPAAFDRRFTLFAGWRPGNRNRLPIARYLSQQESRPARPAHSSSLGMSLQTGTEKSTARLICPEPVSLTRLRTSRASSSDWKATEWRWPLRYSTRTTHISSPVRSARKAMLPHLRRVYCLTVPGRRAQEYLHARGACRHSTVPSLVDADQMLEWTSI